MPLYPCDEEIEYFKELERERNGLTGPTANYYSLNRGKNVDPLYNEPAPFDFRDPVELTVVIEFQEADNEDKSVRDEGMTYEFDAILYIAEAEWSEKIPDRKPKATDVVFVNGKHWDVVKAGSGGNVVDTEEFVGFKLELRHRKKFLPERRLD